MKKPGTYSDAGHFDNAGADTSSISRFLLTFAAAGNNRGRDLAVKILSVFCFVLLLAACGDPHDTIVPADISKWRTTVKPSLQKLAPEEQELFTQYVRRHTIVAAEVGLYGDKADPIPEGMTIGKAIEEQRSYIARQQAKGSKEKTRKDKSGK
jgi:hypothetical protein